MARHEDGFSAVEILVTLLVAGTFLLAFAQLFGATSNIAMLTKEESTGVNILMGYNDENRYWPDSAAQSRELERYEANMRGAAGTASPKHIIIAQDLPVTITPTLVRKDVSVTYNGSRVMKSSTFIRYDGGIFYETN
ncbi:MAG TPA: hypothetical protein VFZ58_01260 [Candidatus Saccharimonadales bacterium]